MISALQGIYQAGLPKAGSEQVFKTVNHIKLGSVQTKYMDTAGTDAEAQIEVVSYLIALTGTQTAVNLKNAV